MKRPDPATQNVERNIERARSLFFQLADKYALKLEWDETSPVELAATLPQQPGLDWPLWLCLQNNDELWIVSRFFTFSWFPMNDAKVEAAIAEALDGILSGGLQLRCVYGSLGQSPCRVELETGAFDKGPSLASYGFGPIFFRFGGAEVILRNGHPTIKTGRAVKLPLP
ncbi:hypothetical protein [Asticcacaulis excentricus]|uniref:hypothetical protein n=1 Tax=Asticcacaulis excentricus TaxID=78587 RepID=UPI000F82C98F|nr:hypothetical protein [Asticcacaulis excentricus]